MNWNNGCHTMMDYGKIVPSIIGRKEPRLKRERREVMPRAGLVPSSFRARAFPKQQPTKPGGSLLPRRSFSILQPSPNCSISVCSSLYIVFSSSLSFYRFNVPSTFVFKPYQELAATTIRTLAQCDCNGGRSVSRMAAAPSQNHAVSPGTTDATLLEVSALFDSLEFSPF